MLAVNCLYNLSPSTIYLINTMQDRSALTVTDEARMQDPSKNNVHLVPRKFENNDAMMNAFARCYRQKKSIRMSRISDTTGIERASFTYMFIRKIRTNARNLFEQYR
jgi:hypothetical protein